MVGYAELPMSGEPAFLIAAVRRFLNPEAPLPNPETIDWTVLLRLAAAHAVTPMLYTALREVSIPHAVAEELRFGFESSAAWSLAQSGELARLVGLFEERAIPVVALKGPMLSCHLYGDLGARTSGDIDVLVKREDVLRSRDALVSSGYRVANTASLEFGFGLPAVAGKRDGFRESYGSEHRCALAPSSAELCQRFR